MFSCQCKTLFKNHQTLKIHALLCDEQVMELEINNHQDGRQDNESLHISEEDVEFVQHEITENRQESVNNSKYAIFLIG